MEVAQVHVEKIEHLDVAKVLKLIIYSMARAAQGYPAAIS
jgi:hypothetical protein